ncbi:hypothetical protein V6N12_025605 [Hibiscus sabdariffa]|uniref:Reverse transcriptase zinc-binding domain-containing protein n=1 Tax=Hibiscus sabdariffa TaxID=183260 RepID=A0ABR2CKS7_9ROSI
MDDDDEILRAEAITFFQNLFSNDNEVRGTFPISGHFLTIPFVEMQHLDRISDSGEIKESLFAMAPLKSSGHKVDKSKSQVYFSPNTDDGIVVSFSDMLGITQVFDLGYLSCWSSNFGKFRALYHSYLCHVGLSTSSMCVCYIERIIRQFIWGGSPISHGAPLVIWDILAQPRLHGGLGLRQLSHHNSAFLMKMCYKITTDTNNFWTSDAIVDDNVLVQDVVLDNGDWNWPFLQHLLQPGALPYIMNIHAPSATSGSDRYIWPCGKHGIFSIKSTYKHLVQDTWAGKDMKWKSLWHLHIPECIRYFLWLASHGKLLTNLNRFTRNLTEDHACPVCGAAEESILHVL